MPKNKISTKQAQFKDSKAARVLNVGTRGAAKSSGIAIAAIETAAKHPGIPLLCSRNDLTDFKKTTYRELRKFLPKTWIDTWNRQEQEITLRNGSTIIYPELKDPESLKSLNLGGVFLDEANEVSFESYSTLEGTLRWRHPTELWAPPYFIKMACNAEPFWGRELFRDGMLPDDVPLPESEYPNYDLMYSYCKDNIFLPDDFEANLRARWPANWVKRYLDLYWDALEGAIWPEFGDIDLLPAEPTHKFPKNGIVLDHGRVHPTASLFFKYDPFLPWIHFYDEFWKKGSYVDTNAPRIWAKLLGKKPDIQVACHSISMIRGRTKKNRPSILSTRPWGSILIPVDATRKHRSTAPGCGSRISGSRFPPGVCT